MSTPRMPVVWVPQEPRTKDPVTGAWKTVNMLDLLNYGKVEVLLEAGEQVTFNAASTVRRIRDKLIDYQPQDFVVGAGDPVAIGILCSFAAIAGRGSYKMLKWDRQERKYFLVPINLRGDA